VGASDATNTGAAGCTSACINLADSTGPLVSPSGQPVETSLGGKDVVAAGLGAFSSGMSSYMETQGVEAVSKLGVQYGLPSLLMDAPGGVGAAFALVDTGIAVANNNPQQAVVSGVGGIFSIGGAELGAAAGSLAPGAFKAPAVAVGAGVGGLIFGSIGMQVGNWINGAINTLSSSLYSMQWYINYPTQYSSMPPMQSGISIPLGPHN